VKPESPLAFAIAKAKWAESKIENVNTQIKAFLASCPYRTVSEVNTQADEEIWYFELSKCVPLELSFEVGAIIQGLRAPLDQALSAVSSKHCGRESGVAFPFGRCEDEFQTALRKQEEFLPPAIIKIIEAEEPYKGGNDLLFNLNLLNRDDKHRPRLVPINLRSTATKLTKLTVLSGGPLVLGSRAATNIRVAKRSTPEELAKRTYPYEFFTMPTHATVGRPGGPKRQVPLDGSAGITVGALQLPTEGAGTAKETMEFLTAILGTKFETDMQPTFDIALAEVDGLKPEPVVAVLHQMASISYRLLLAFEEAFPA
jgi:hypothetical protein